MDTSELHELIHLKRYFVLADDIAGVPVELTLDQDKITATAKTNGTLVQVDYYDQGGNLLMTVQNTNFKVGLKVI